MSSKQRYHWPLNNTGGRGADPWAVEHPQPYTPLTLPKLKLPFDVNGELVARPSGTLTCPIWHGVECMHLALCTRRLPTADWKIYRDLLKKSAYKWTRAAQTCVFQQANVFSPVKMHFFFEKREKLELFRCSYLPVFLEHWRGLRGGRCALQDEDGFHFHVPLGISYSCTVLHMVCGFLYTNCKLPTARNMCQIVMFTCKN